MLTVYESLPPGLLDSSAADLHRILPGPSLIHLPGRREPALFVSVLLHGNETTGWEAMRRLLARYTHAGRQLPRALSLFIGNVAAARENLRRLPDQVDYNRIWGPGGRTGLPGVNGDDRSLSELPEVLMTERIQADMRARGIFASVDLHNNTGLNPHYACVNSLAPEFLNLAALFGRTLVYFLHPKGVQSLAFSGFCPAVTLECGQSEDPAGIEHAREFVDACLHLEAFPTHAPDARDFDCFHTVAVVRVPPDSSIGFAADDNGPEHPQGEADPDFLFPPRLERMNFRELEAGTLLAWLKKPLRLEVRDEYGRDLWDRFLEECDGEIRTRTNLMPSMLTRNETIIRQDCLCYFMERFDADQIAAIAREETALPAASDPSL